MGCCFKPTFTSLGGTILHDMAKTRPFFPRLSKEIGFPQSKWDTQMIAKLVDNFNNYGLQMCTAVLN